MRKVFFALSFLLAFSLTGCSENYANGERIGLVTRFTKKGILWKSWEGSLNLTQTGMNSSGIPFDFSVDNDKPENTVVIAMIDSAANLGWKIKVKYHETLGFNWFSNRGETDHFITDVEVLDRIPIGMFRGSEKMITETSGKTVDTVFVIVVGRTSEGYTRKK